MTKPIGSVPTRARQFRILALPLARLPRPTPSAPAAANAASSETKPTPLILYHVSQPDASPESGPPTLSQRALNKASDVWLKLGEKDKKSVSYWFYKKGEGLMDKIEYEEWALKNIQEGRGVKIIKKGEPGTQEKIEIPLLKPAFEDAPLPPLLPKLHRFLIHRIPYHRKMMWRSLFATPLTAPFAIIPVIPNFPFFYVLWRAWSHYKAWKGAEYLEDLLKLGMIVEKPSKDLDAVYKSKGVAVAVEGAENIAPDETFSEGVKLGKSSGKGYQADDQVKKDGDKLVKQAKGEEGAIDGTATPKSMVFEGKEKESAGVLSEQSLSPKTRHPAILLSPAHVPLLARAFDFRPNETIDVNRAVEQAELRVRAADAANVAKTEAK